MFSSLLPTKPLTKRHDVPSSKAHGLTRTDSLQDGSGWTPLMMAVSQPEGDTVVDLLLKKGADVSCKSNWSHFLPGTYASNTDIS